MHRACRQDVLHVAPAKVRIGLEHERDDAAHDRGRRRRAVKGVCVVAVFARDRVVAIGALPVGGHDVAGSAASRRRHQDRCTVIGIVRREAIARGRRDRDREPRRIEAVAVRIKIVVARGLDDDGAEAVAPVVDGINHIR